MNQGVRVAQSSTGCTISSTSIEKPSKSVHSGARLLFDRHFCRTNLFAGFWAPNLH